MATDDKHPDFPVVPAGDKEEFVTDAVRDGLSDGEQAQLDQAENIARGVSAPGVPDYDPRGATLDEDDSEFGEPEVGEDGVTEFNPTMDDNDIQPYVVNLVFHGAARPIEEDKFNELVEAVIFEAERRGLYYYHGSTGRFPMEMIAPGTPIHQAVTGQH